MIFDIAVNPLIKPLAFSIAALPVMVENLRTGMISNWGNAILLLAGLAVLTLEPTFGMSGFHLPVPLPWSPMKLILLAFFVRMRFGGGAVKFLVALLPWFSTDEYLLVTTARCALASIIGYVRGIKEVQIAPQMVVIGLLVLAVGTAGGR